jgi:hypothetical protein
VTTAVVPARGGAVWLQVAEPRPARPLFEAILGSVRAEQG